MLKRCLIIAFFSLIVLVGCKTKMENMTLSTCKAIETNSKKCSELVSQELEIIDSNQSRVSEKIIPLD